MAPEIGGPSLEERQIIYAHLEMNDHSIQQVENMIRGSGTRSVGKGALTNVRVRHNSRKNGAVRVVESHTCELVFAYELELDEDVIGYYVQVPMHRVRRLNKNGALHLSSAHVDFLVLRKTSIELVECKQAQYFERENLSGSVDWTLGPGGWTHLPYAEWAAERQLEFRVWISPRVSGIYLQNLELCYEVLKRIPDEREHSAMEKVRARTASKPASLQELAEEVPEFSESMAAWMIADGRAYGTWKSVSVSDPKFILYQDKEQAEIADRTLCEKAAESFAALSIRDPLLIASATDLCRARQRLARLQAIEEGLLPTTARMAQLARKVQRAVASGQTALSASLTSYAKCGNRTSRLLPEQEQAIETVMSRLWNTGKITRPLDLFHELELECRRLGVEPCGRSRLDLRRRSESPTRHALRSGGLRAYQAVRPLSDPRTRSQRPVGFGQVLHIDSSDLDVRCAPNLIALLPASKAKLYIGIDGATGLPMAHSLIFGPARTDGLALLMREYVARHHKLPAMIHLDRGPENTSGWLEEFCEGRISVRYSPTAGSAWNGLAENAIKQVNFQVAHRMPGSTAPDQMGRQVDGKYKSARTARMPFLRVADAVREFLYEELPKVPDSQGRTPNDKREEAFSLHGHVGTPCELNDDLLIQTSLPIPLRKRDNPLKGIRTAEGWFTSEELLDALRSHKPTQLRSDCGNPTVLYVQIGRRWIKAFHSRVQSAALLSPDERLHDHLSEPIRRSEARRRRSELSRSKHLSRSRLAEAAKTNTEVSSSEPPSITDESSGSDRALNGRCRPGASADFGGVRAFEEREDY